MPVQLRGPVVAAPRAARASRSRSTAVVAAASREQNAVPAAVLSLLLATAPLVDVSAAFAAVATPDQIAAAEKEGEARLKSCTTDECRSVITALNTKKMAKLTGQPAPSVRAVTAPAKKAAPAAAAPKAAPAAAVATAPKPAAPKPVAAAAKPAAGSKDSGAAAAAAKKKAEEAKKKAAAEAKKRAEAKKKASSGGGSNPLLFILSFAGKVAFAAGALAAPFIYLKKEEVILDESGSISTEKAVATISGAATDLVDKVPNKDTVALYGIGALVALGVTDGIINLPLLNILIGAPVQILGFVTALALGVRYFKEGGDAGKDAKGLALKLNGLVPEGLPKPLSPELEAEFKSKW